MSGFSYRVAYRREGGPRLITRHYETLSAACAKVRRLKSIEAAKLAGEFDGTSFDRMEPLVELRLERRPVGPWEADPWQPEVSEYDMDAARDYAERLRNEKRTYAFKQAGEVPF